MTAKQKIPRAVVITPTYNESGNVEHLVEILKNVFAKVDDYEMMHLVVDDTSPDKTYEIVEKLQRKNSQLKLLINPEKSGLGGAYLKGMDYAFNKLNADVVFEFDADMQHDETKIPAFLKKISEGYDFVLGSRYIKGGSIPETWGFSRKFLSVVGNWVIMLVLTDFRIHDWTSGFRAITEKVYRKISPAMNNKEFQGYTFQVAFLHKTVRAGFKVAEVPFKFAERTAGESKLGTEYIKNNLMYLFKARFQEIVNHRIFKFLCVGGVGTLVQLCFFSLVYYVLGMENYNFGQILATIIGTEMAIISNFLLNNIWTFNDRKLCKDEYCKKFITFNLGSLGSVIIQLLVNYLGPLWFGVQPLFNIFGIAFDSAILYQIAGIIIGLFVNFFIYNKIIWRKK